MPQMWSSEQILKMLDECCDAFTFPVLDNGYFCLAATRLSLHRSANDWAMVFEVFEFSPRRGELPDIHIYTFGSHLQDRDTLDNFVDTKAYENYLKTHPFNDSRFIYPISEGAWQDSENDEYVAMGASEIGLRECKIPIPPYEEFSKYGIELKQPPRIQTFELCRLLAASHREKVLASVAERRISVAPDLHEILLLDEWNHPDVGLDDRPSKSETFQQLAKVLQTGDSTCYQPTSPSNTHWRNWPEGGSLLR